MAAVKPLLAVALLAAFAVGCSTGLSVVGGAVDAGPPGDVTLDATVPDKPDVSVMDAPADAPALDGDAPAPDGDAPDRCAANPDCAGDPGGPVCDATTGRCVACTAASDLCPDGRYCDDASRTCLRLRAVNGAGQMGPRFIATQPSRMGSPSGSSSSSPALTTTTTSFATPSRASTRADHSPVEMSSESTVPSSRPARSRRSTEAIQRWYGDACTHTPTAGRSGASPRSSAIAA